MRNHPNVIPAGPGGHGAHPLRGEAGPTQARSKALQAVGLGLWIGGEGWRRWVMPAGHTADSLVQACLSRVFVMHQECCSGSTTGPAAELEAITSYHHIKHNSQTP
jgi:hypothetical protein